MKRTAILLASAAAVTAAPAQARDGEMYVGADLGLLLEDQVDVDLAQTDPQTNAAFAETNQGIDTAIVLGYDFGGFRLEAEGAYKTAGIDDITILNPTFTADGFGQPVSVVADDADLRIFSGMLNGLLEFGSDDGIQVFAGGGVGFASIDLTLDPGQIGPLVDDSGSDLAYQALAGARIAVSDRLDVGLKYRYFVIDEFELEAINGAPIEVDFQSHSILASLVYNFGSAPVEAPIPVPPPAPARPATPPPPQPPAPVAEPPRPACNAGPYIVFFDFDQASITADAAAILDSAVTAYANCGAARVMLAGHTDRSGSVAYNIGLAERRNASVEQYLSGRGIPSSVISSQAFGEAQTRVPTADGVRELQNRRVEITYGPGSGM